MSEPRLAQCDVVIIGSGLAGTTCAAALHGRGYRVALVDARVRHPHEFRAEKFSHAEMDVFERRGLGAAARAVATPLDEVFVAEGRRIVEVARTREYGFHYSDLINALRTGLPEGIVRHVGRVDAIEGGGEAPRRLILADGSAIEARLVVVATGLGLGIHRLLDIPQVCDFKGHSLSLGFTLARELSAFPFRHRIDRPVRLGDRISYLTLFALGERMRANLFVYRPIGDPWVRAFREHPAGGLAALFPHLGEVCGDLAVEGSVEARPMDLVRSLDPMREGIVLIGDAYCTTCPTAGAGMAKALADVERLCAVHAPAWLSQPGPVLSTAAFYADPVKQESDRHSIAASRELRAFLVETGARNVARRWRSRVYRTGLDLVRRSGRSLLGQGALGPRLSRG